jgi:hypothetical protein
MLQKPRSPMCSGGPFRTRPAPWPGVPSYNGGKLADHAAGAVDRLRPNEDHSNDQRAQAPKFWLGPGIPDDVELREQSRALRTLNCSCYWPVSVLFFGIERIHRNARKPAQ